MTAPTGFCRHGTNYFYVIGSGNEERDFHGEINRANTAASVGVSRDQRRVNRPGANVSKKPWADLKSKRSWLDTVKWIGKAAK